MVLKFRVVADTETFLRTETGHACPEITVERPPPEMDGDITINCFRLAKPLGSNPMKLAEMTVRFLEGHADVSHATQVKAFVNITLERGAVFRDTVADRVALVADAAFLPEADRQRVLVEFSAPNTNKPQHLGHVRNNTIGEATVALLRKVGHEAIPVNLVNDRGIHICKSMLAYQRYGHGETPAGAGKKGDHFVGDYYVRFDNELRRQVAELKSENPELADRTSEELFTRTEIGAAAQAMLVAWEQDDPEVRRLWETMNRWVLEGFGKTYRRMGVRFTKTYLESETFSLGRDIVMRGLKEGVFHRRDDGAVEIDLSDMKLDRKVVLRSDGTSVYITQDLGTTLLKQHDFEPDRQIWVVGDEQIYHFRVLFAILRKLGYEWADQLTHMVYGMVNLPSGRMKSREGTVVDADDLFDEMERLARQATLDRAEEPPEDLDRRASVIGMAALKFMLLKVNPKTTLLFDPEASVKFEGDTGPYLLYAYARISSMLRKAGDPAPAGTVDWGVLGTNEEVDLALRCADYGSALRKAAEGLDTSPLATYLLDLAKAFSRFYRECPVLAAPSPEMRLARLELSRCVQTILKDGLEAFTIEVLESM